MTLLSVSDLRVSLGRAEVLHGVSLDVKPGEFVGLIGPNGAGKSSLLRAIIQLLDYSGTVRLDGIDAGSLTATARAGRVAYLAQEREVAWAVPVDMLVALGRTHRQAPFSPMTTQDHAAVDRAMQRMDVSQFRARRATDLSGGELARVLIARALAQDAPLLLADEPAAGLDPAHQIGLMRTFAQLAADGHGVIASMHDLGLAARWCSRLVLLHAGRIVADGAPRQVLTPDRMVSVYGVTVGCADIDGHWIVQPMDLARNMEETPHV